MAVDVKTERKLTRLPLHDPEIIKKLVEKWQVFVAQQIPQIWTRFLNVERYPEEFAEIYTTIHKWVKTEADKALPNVTGWSVFDILAEVFGKDIKENTHRQYILSAHKHLFALAINPSQHEEKWDEFLGTYLDKWTLTPNRQGKLIISGPKSNNIEATRNILIGMITWQTINNVVLKKRRIAQCVREGCGKWFGIYEPMKKKQRFCSDYCRKRHWKQQGRVNK